MVNMSKKETRDAIYLRVNLKGLTLKRFLMLKQHYGLTNDTELVRLLISGEYQKLFGEP